jgi:hypothetical protein
MCVQDTCDSCPRVTIAAQGEPVAPPNGNPLKELHRHLPRTIKLWLELDHETVSWQAAKQLAACCIWHTKKSLQHQQCTLYLCYSISDET